METIECTVEGTVFRNEDNGYTVLSVRLNNRTRMVVGNLPALSPGEKVLLSGEWTEHAKYGRQFKCASCEIRKPDSLQGIERYLGSGLIRGIGPKTAKLIVAAFGKNTLEILSEHPERLQELPGMGKKRWAQIAESFHAQALEREAMIFLQGLGISPGMGAKIVRTYGERTVETIRKNPYRLCLDIEGIGFLTADRIAMSAGIAADSPFRVQAALMYVLQTAASASGHVFLPRQELIRQTASMLSADPAFCGDQLDQIALERLLIRRRTDEGEQIYLPAFNRAEQEVAARLCEMIAAAGKRRIPHAAAKIDRFEREHAITFSERQRQAIASAAEFGVLVITGGPGTGKTTIINCIIELMKEFGTVTLCAPTGRAAKRMTEATGLESSTIHRMLEYGGENASFSRNQDNPLETDCLIVDEMSMVDLLLMRSLLNALQPGTRLILVGDSDQLPSVGAGNVLGDILQSGVVPAVRLTDIFRQGEHSSIVVNAHRINRGEMPLLNEKASDFFFVRRDNMSDTAQTVVSLITERLPKYLQVRPEDRVRSIQVLSPMRKGACGVETLNELLQTALNPPSPRKPSIEHGDLCFRLGDKVMQIRNNYEMEWTQGGEDGSGVFNGDVGFIAAVDKEERTLTVAFEDGREAVYLSDDLEDLDLAYCLSVHKSQGSEFRVVVLPVVGGPPMLLTRNLFYTAMTRAKELVVLVGSENCIRQMVENNSIVRRYTGLPERLRQSGSALLRTDE